MLSDILKYRDSFEMCMVKLSEINKTKFGIRTYLMLLFSNLLFTTEWHALVSLLSSVSIVLIDDETLLWKDDCLY